MTLLQALTLFHTAISIAAILAGIPVVVALLNNTRHRWTGAFLFLAVATSVTGYFFPFNGVTPAMITGAIALIILALVYVAQRRLADGRGWQWVYAGGIVASLYLLLFVAVVQAFLKIRPLHQLAPNGSEPPFTIAHLTVLALSIVVGVVAASRFRPAATAPTPYPPGHA